MDGSRLSTKLRRAQKELARFRDFGKNRSCQLPDLPGFAGVRRRPLGGVLRFWG